MGNSAVVENPAVFDAVAASYDAGFTDRRLGQMLRQRLWRKLDKYFTPGQQLLELGCGTGEDAVWLARRGLEVLATDGSVEMVRATQAKADRAGVATAVQTRQVSLQEAAAGYFSHRSHGITTSFDGVYSNFGGLNTIAGWRPLARALAELLRPGGIVVLTPMGPYCPWEIAWFLAHGRLREAGRRRRPASATVGSSKISVFYPSAWRLRRDFSAWFDHLETTSLGLLMPPSYLDGLVERWPGLFDKLNRLEAATAHLTRGWGDHYVIVFKRKYDALTDASG